MLSLDALRSFGANVEEGMARCMNNEAFYLRLVRLSLQDGNFNRLEEALAKGDLKAGFEAAHGLKGSLGNLALTPLYLPISEMTELLRAGRDMEYEPFLRAVRETREQLLALCE